MKKENNGITLIALIITIILMLILASVTINVIIDDGLFNYAGNAKNETEIASEKETVQKSSILAESTSKTGRITEEEVQNAIDSITGGNVAIAKAKGSNIIVQFNKSNRYYKINKNGNVQGPYASEIDAILPEKSYEEAGKDGEGYLTENATYESGKYTAVVPEGFKIIPGVDGTTTIADGLVIKDSKGNEFVWIPVTYTKTNKDDNNNGYDDGFDAVFYRSNWSNNDRRTGLSSSYTEPYVSGYSDGQGTEEAKDYNEMVNSVYENGGFYIGRYEAGSQDESGNPVARTDKANGTSKVVVKRDQYPYIYVGWGAGMSDYTSDVGDDGKGALYLCKHMYDEQDIGATSTLCYGIQWDAMLDFIKDDTHNVTNSTSWGNYEDNDWIITRTTAKWTATPSSDTTWTGVTADGKSKTSRESILLTTGANDSFSAKNIYDVAGNVWEWTNEAYSSTVRVNRGSGYLNNGSSYPASYRNYNKSYPTNCFITLGFRPALYIK